jgi:hypothetical protein
VSASTAGATAPEQHHHHRARAATPGGGEAEEDGLLEDGGGPPTTRGLFARDLPPLLYGCGDVPAPLPETLDVVEDALCDYIAAVTQAGIDGAARAAAINAAPVTGVAAAAATAAAGGGGGNTHHHQPVPSAGGPPTRLHPEDVLFLFRKDGRKFARARALLAAADEIAAAKRGVDEDALAALGE